MNTRREGARLIEVLHVALLQVLPSHVPASDYIVKGGANLRLYYHSRRRSQDIDLDYAGTRFHTLEAGVDRALASRAFNDILRLAGIAMSEPTKPKQTDTTRRWKFTVSGGGAFLNTKVEFSSRGEPDPEHAFEPVASDIGLGLGLRVVRAEHYLPPAAIRQKIGALAHRSETEPRDMFDLDLLLSRFPDVITPGDVPPELLEAAVTAALAIPYEAYEELVVEFIEDEWLTIYGRPEVWTDMVLRVVEHLESLR
jgi:hypothetical protein